MKKRSLVFSALAALLTAGVLAGCGNSYYFAGRVLPPSGIANRVLIAIQNPSASATGALQFVDAYYDIRQSFNDKTPIFVISGFSGQLPITIQNMPEEQIGAIYGSGDGSLSVANYANENTSPSLTSTLNGKSSGVFLSRSQSFVIAASQQSHVLTVVDLKGSKSYALSLPGVYHVSMNPGGSVMMAFVENSNVAYYPRKLQSSESIAYSGGPSTWPVNAVDCEPLNLPGMCLFQVGDPSGKPYTYFDRPVKTIFSADGSLAYVLNCGPECGGSKSGVTVLPTAPMILTSGQQSGSIPATPTVIPVPGGASNALETPSGPLDAQVDTLYVLGEGSTTGTLSPGQLFSGYLTPINLTNNTAAAPISVSDSAPGQRTRMIVADDNTLWLGGIRCTQGQRYATGQAYGCLTMFNTVSNTVTMIEPYQGDLTGLAAVTTLHKLYIAEGGQVYIYSTVDGSAINNFYVTVTGTAYDVAYMDATTDTNNTVY